MTKSSTTPVALITGAGKRRIGSHIADALAKRGYRLALHYHSSRQEALAAVARYAEDGIEAIPLQADLNDDIELQSLVDQTLTHFGQIDLLVNTAAIWEPKPFEDVEANDVMKHFATNTLAPFRLSQIVGMHMTLQKHGGNIVLFGDWAEIRPYPNYAAYFPSKAAIPGMTRTLAMELGTRNPEIRVNAILPGPVMLPDDLPEAERNEAIAATLVKREGSPEHVVQTVLFFVDNDFLTGVCLPVDGGRSIYAP